MSGFLPPGAMGPVAMAAAGGAAANWWEIAGQTCVAAYKPIGAADLATSYINLATPGTYNAAPGVAPTLGAAGWVCDGTTQYLTTGIIVSDTNWSMIARFSGATLGNRVVAGAYQSETKAFVLWPQFAALGNTGYNPGRVSAGYALTDGITAIAGQYLYRNGTQEAGAATAGDVPTIELYIGRANGLTYFYQGTIAAIAIYKPTEPSTTPMSASDVAALTARMAALA